MNIINSLNEGLERKFKEEENSVKRHGAANRYKAVRYGRYQYAILDTQLGKEGLLLRVGPHPDYSKPVDKRENKLMLFSSKEQADSYIQDHLE